MKLNELIFTVALTPVGSAIVLYAGNDPAAARRAMDRAKGDFHLSTIGIWEKLPPTFTNEPKEN